METEAKIRVPSLPPVKTKILRAGGRLLQARTFEGNTLFDVAGGGLRASGRSFRIRRYGAQGVVTFKGVARVSGGVKSRDELETEVASPEVFSEILHALGFVPQFRYEKFREMWKVGSTVVCLDETPLGAFVEIEGALSAIGRVARSLGLDLKHSLSDSYPALWTAAGRVGPMVFPRPARARRTPGRAAVRARKRA